MWLKNTWYVAAFEHELDEQMVARRLRLPLKTGVHSPIIKRQFCAAPPTSVVRTASG